jgi:hypothetical protein
VEYRGADRGADGEEGDEAGESQQGHNYELHSVHTTFPWRAGLSSCLCESTVNCRPFDSLHELPNDREPDVNWGPS